MNSKQIGLIIALLTCIGTPLGLWIKMQVNDAKHDLELKNHKEMIMELKKEVKDNRTNYEESISELSKKIDNMPQKILDLMNSVNAASERHSGRGN